MTRSKDAYIEVHAERDKGGMKYWFESKHKKPGTGDEELVFYSPDGSDWKMVFIIQNNDLGLAFKEGKRDAFWVSKTECPQSPSYDLEFEALRVTPERKRLVVVNRNKTKCDYRFSLNFDSDIGPLSYDPIISNQNGWEGGDPPFGNGGQLLAIAASVVGALAALFGLKRLLGKNKDKDRRF